MSHGLIQGPPPSNTWYQQAVCLMNNRVEVGDCASPGWSKCQGGTDEVDMTVLSSSDHAIVRPVRQPVPPCTVLAPVVGASEVELLLHDHL